MYSFDRKSNRYSSGRFWIKGLIRKFDQYPDTNFDINENTIGSAPLYLNEFIENRNIDEAREAALTEPFCGNVKSYSGFLSVDQEKESHLFFWFFPSENQAENTPLIVWLNGWTTPSTYGVFVQNGPYFLTDDGVSLREISWHKWYNIVYFDNPLGVGYSHAPESKYSTDLKILAKNLYWGIHYFYKLFPELRPNDLYLCGVSMGGNYITHLAKEIELANSVRKNKINLKGLFVGNPFVGGAYQMQYHKFLYENGLIDECEMDILKSLEENMIQHVNEGRFEEAMKSAQGIIYSSNSYIKDLTGLTDLYDMRQIDSYMYDSTMKQYTNFMKRDEVKRRLHVGDVPFSEDVQPFFLLRSQIPKPSTDILQTLIKNYKCLFYCGQFDIICNYPSFAKVLREMTWEDKEQFIRVTRNKIYDSGKLCGYLKSYGNLSEILVRNAGHCVVQDEPRLTINLLHYLIQFYDVNNLTTKIRSY